MSPFTRRRLVLLIAFLALAAVLPLLGADDSPAGRRYALLVGVKNYNKDQLRNLDYTENDVNDLAAVLKDAGYKRVVLMTQAAAADQRDNTLLPTGQNIRDQLAGLLEDRKPGDAVLVALSGHGVQPRGEKGSYFCPMDARLADPRTLVSLADVYRALEDCKADARVLLVDACRNDPLAGGDKGVEKVKLESVTRPPAEAPPGGVAALFSCSEGEQSYESARSKHGIFFHLVIEGLKGAAPKNKQGEVTLEYLAGYVKDEAADAAKDEWGPKARQHPELMGKTSGSGVLAAAAVKEETVNTVGMKLKLIKPGKFLMGSPKGEEGRYDNEGPQHEVEITRAFSMGVYPVTKGQFAAFVKDDGYSTEAERANDKNTWRNPYFSSKYDQTDNDPVVEVSWNDAVRFCQWLSKKEGKTYELPTEAEWEYACRAGTTTAFFFGGDGNRLDDYAWYDGNSGGHTHPVGGKKGNPWGLYDMGGNVWQWCADGYDQYQEGPIKDPKGKESSNSRVLRGGSWGNEPRNCRSAIRVDLVPGSRRDGIGFRVVLRAAVRTP